MKWKFSVLRFHKSHARSNISCGIIEKIIIHLWEGINLSNTRFRALAPSLESCRKICLYLYMKHARQLKFSSHREMISFGAFVSWHEGECLSMIVKSRLPFDFSRSSGIFAVRERFKQKTFSEEVLHEANISRVYVATPCPEISFLPHIGFVPVRKIAPFSCLRRGWLNRRMFFGHWEYIEGGGVRGWWRVLLYGDQSSRMISTFPSTTMPRELYAIRYTNQAGRSGTGEGGKVAAGVILKSIQMR